MRRITLFLFLAALLITNTGAGCRTCWDQSITYGSRLCGSYGGGLSCYLGWVLEYFECLVYV